MSIFIDTSAFLALFIPNEREHLQVVAKYQAYRKARARFFTSYYVLDELLTRLIYDFGKTLTQKTLHLLNLSIEQEELALLDIDPTTFKKAMDIFLKFSEHKISMTDATTYVLYKDLSLDEIFTLDSDFKKIRANTSC